MQPSVLNLDEANASSLKYTDLPLNKHEISVNFQNVSIHTFRNISTFFEMLKTLQNTLHNIVKPVSTYIRVITRHRRHL